MGDLHQIQQVVEQFEAKYGPIYECRIVGWDLLRTHLELRLRFENFEVDYSFQYGESVFKL